MSPFCISVANDANRGPSFKELFALAKSLRLGDTLAIDDPAVQERLAEFYVKATALRFTRHRIMTSLARGEPAGPEASIGKIVVASKIQEAAAYGLDLLGSAGVQCGSDMPLGGIFEESFLDSPAFRIAGGTDEILRNTIAERILGLPQDRASTKAFHSKIFRPVDPSRAQAALVHFA